MNNLITISPSPHAQTPTTVTRLMMHVIIALIPAVLVALYYFGLGAVIATSIIGCVAVEYLITRFMLGQKPSIGNLSAVLTGLLLALNLPSNLPVWTVLIGCVVAIGIGKMAFGGLGCNIFNPALVGRVFLLLSFPVAMTTWPIPGENLTAYTDATTGATVLGLLKQHIITPSDVCLLDGAIGNMGGSVGIELLSGGLMLGAIFMATDYVTSPMSHKGQLLYGVMIGIITLVIRLWGAYPEGMSFAILIMNGVTPLINRYMKPRKFGERRAAA